MNKNGKNIRSGICLFLGLEKKNDDYKYMQLKITCVASQYKEIYSNEKKVTKILNQGFVYFWALVEEKIITSMYSLR